MAAGPIVIFMNTMDTKNHAICGLCDMPVCLDEVCDCGLCKGKLWTLVGTMNGRQVAYCSDGECADYDQN